MFSRHPTEAPRLEIRLDVEEPVVFFPGDVITGTLSFRYHVLTTIDDVCVVNASILTFSGLAKTMIEVRTGTGTGSDSSSTYYRGRAPLLNLTQPLTTLSHTDHLDGKGREWPFAFTVPHNHVIDAYPPLPSSWHTHDSHWSTFGPDDRFSGNTSFQLPPSFRADVLQCSAYVEYSLTAQLWLSRGGNTRKPLRAEREITLAPLPPASFPLPGQSYDRLAIRSLRLLPENETRKLSFKEKAGGFFHRSGLPMFEFQCTGILPQAVSLGERPSFTLQLMPDTQISTAPMPASLTLKHCCITVYGLTLARVPRLGSYEYRNDRRVVFQDEALFAEGACLNKGNGYSVTMSLSRPVTGFKPTFTTYDISRSYTIRVQWVLECVGETLRVKFEIPVVGVSGHVRSPPT